MPFSLTMPKLSPTMEEGTIVKWHKAVDDYVEVGDVVIEVATDKATVEYSAIDSGYLKKILVKAGEAAVVNEAIAVLTEEKHESIEGYKPPQVEKESAEKIDDAKEAFVKPEKKEKPKHLVSAGGLPLPEFVPEPPLKNYTFEMPSGAIEKRIKASPLAKKLAKEKGLDLSTVKGSGPGHRIVKDDLERAQKSGLICFGRREEPIAAPGTYVEEGLSPIRKIIAKRLQESKAFIPHFYLHQQIDAAPLSAIREQLASFDIKVSVNDLIVRAVALALRRFPEVNSGYHSVNGTIIRYQTIDISVAVSIEGGLITPIIRHADYKNIGEISLEIKALAKRAKEGKLEEHEYKGGSFTVSNLGMFGTTDFLPIINPPQAAILAAGAITDAPVVKNGSVVAGKIMNLTLSCDHRVIDGATSAEFLRELKKILENPAAVLV